MACRPLALPCPRRDAGPPFAGCCDPPGIPDTGTQVYAFPMCPLPSNDGYHLAANIPGVLSQQPWVRTLTPPPPPAAAPGPCARSIGRGAGLQEPEKCTQPLQLPPQPKRFAGAETPPTGEYLGRPSAVCFCRLLSWLSWPHSSLFSNALVFLIRSTWGGGWVWVMVVGGVVEREAKVKRPRDLCLWHTQIAACCDVDAPLLWFHTAPHCHRTEKNSG